MASGHTDNKAQSKFSEQYVLNDIYEELLHAIGVFNVGWNGQEGEVQAADSLAVKVTVAGSLTYVGVASPGTTQASALWQCKLIDSSSDTIVTWADGNSKYDNIA